MKLESTLLAVRDMDQSVAFYQEVLGLKVINDFGANKTLSGGLALQTLDTWQKFIGAEDVSFGSKAYEIYFEEEDFDRFVQRLGELDVEYVHPVKEHAWGQRVVRIYDPDRHIIEIGEDIKAVCRRFLETGMTVAETAVRMDVPEEYVRECVNLRLIFQSEHIDFTEVSEFLVKDYLLMVNDDENVNRFIGSRNKTYTEEQEIQWVKKKHAENAPVYSMIERETGKYIGNIELMNLTGTEGELGIAITAGMQNTGYGTEAVRALAEYGIQQLGLKRIYLRANPENKRAIHVYEKCGFREYDRTENHVYMEMTG